MESLLTVALIGLLIAYVEHLDKVDRQERKEARIDELINELKKRK